MRKYEMVNGVRLPVFTEEERNPKFGTEQKAAIINQVLLGMPAPENEEPEAAAYRKKFTEEDLPILQRIPGATVFTPE